MFSKFKTRFLLYLNDEKIVIEMDGAQHFEPIRIFGGTEGFNKTQEQDKRKNYLCNELGIHLLRIDYLLDPDEYIDAVLNFLFEIRCQFSENEENKPIRRIERFIGEIYEKRVRLQN